MHNTFLYVIGLEVKADRNKYMFI